MFRIGTNYPGEQVMSIEEAIQYQDPSYPFKCEHCQKEFPKALIFANSTKWGKLCPNCYDNERACRRKESVQRGQKR